MKGKTTYIIIPATCRGPAPEARRRLFTGYRKDVPKGWKIWKQARRRRPSGGESGR